MTITTPFGFDSTAAEVIDGVNLTGKRAKITGASSGIGIETARVLASAGAAVTLAVRDTGQGERVVAEFGGERTTVRQLDLSDLSNVAAFVDAWNGPLTFL